jgi:hypothetical protein
VLHNHFLRAAALLVLWLLVPPSPLVLILLGLPVAVTAHMVVLVLQQLLLAVQVRLLRSTAVSGAPS